MSSGTINLSVFEAFLQIQISNVNLEDENRSCKFCDFLRKSGSAIDRLEEFISNDDGSGPQ